MAEQSHLTTRRRSIGRDGELSWGDSAHPWESETDSSNRVTFENGTVRAGAPIPDSGVLRYAFEQDVTDAWGDNNATDHTDTGYTTETVVGEYAKAFDGTPGVVTAPPAAAYDFGGTDHMSLSAWVKFNAKNTKQVVVAGRKSGTGNLVEKTIETDGNGHLMARVYKHSITGPAYDVGVWYHCVFTYTPDAYYFYVNENQYGPKSHTANRTDHFDIGGLSAEKNQFYLDGSVADCRAYNMDITATEVSNLRQTGSISG